MDFKIQVKLGDRITPNRVIPAGTWRDRAAEKYSSIRAEYQDKYLITLIGGSDIVLQGRGTKE